MEDMNYAFMGERAGDALGEQIASVGTLAEMEMIFY